MILLLTRVTGAGIETADMLVREALSRTLRDRRALARLGGLKGSPDAARRVRQSRLGPAAHRHDPIGLAHTEVPEGQRARAVVPGPDGRWRSQNAKNYDCGARPQAAHRPVALGDDR
jgi:hypothetical protein